MAWNPLRYGPMQVLVGVAGYPLIDAAVAQSLWDDGNADIRLALAGNSGHPADVARAAIFGRSAKLRTAALAATPHTSLIDEYAARPVRANDGAAVLRNWNASRSAVLAVLAAQPQLADTARAATHPNTPLRVTRAHPVVRGGDSGRITVAWTALAFVRHRGLADRAPLKLGVNGVVAAGTPWISDRTAARVARTASTTQRRDLATNLWVLHDRSLLPAGTTEIADAFLDDALRVGIDVDAPIDAQLERIASTAAGVSALLGLGSIAVDRWLAVHAATVDAGIAAQLQVRRGRAIAGAEVLVPFVRAADPTGRVAVLTGLAGIRLDEIGALDVSMGSWSRQAHHYGRFGVEIAQAAGQIARAAEGGRFDAGAAGVLVQLARDAAGEDDLDGLVRTALLISQV